MSTRIIRPANSPIKDTKRSAHEDNIKSQCKSEELTVGVCDVGTDRGMLTGEGRHNLGPEAK